MSRSADVVLDPLRRELAKRCLRQEELRTSTLGDESTGQFPYSVTARR
ncbi:hypothetical protein [Streptomyces sp. CB02460]|nr:hypothetical protein [Streptomyces sp. CB02460]